MQYHSDFNIIKEESFENNSSRNFPLLLEQINGLFNKIKHCDSIKEADYYFNVLDEIQCCLCVLVFVKKIKVSEPIRKFVRDFDRLDDKDLRIWLFNQIKEDKYHLL